MMHTYFFWFSHGLVPLSNGAVAALAFLFIAGTLYKCVPLLSRAARPVSKFVRTVDRVILTNITFLTGTRYNTTFRWAMFGGWAAILIQLAAIYPLGFVLPTLLVGLVFVFYVVRHWLVDRSERERGLLHNVSVDFREAKVTERKLIDVDVSLFNEAVWSLALLFALAAIGFSRLDQSSGALNSLSGSIFAPAIRAAAEVIGELPESLPIADTTGVLRDGNLLTRIHYNQAPLKEATFVLRLAYELFFIATFLEWIKSVQRRSLREDIDALEWDLQNIRDSVRIPAFEQVCHLASKGQTNAISCLMKIIRERTFDDLAKLHPRVLRDKAASVLSRIASQRQSPALFREAIINFETDILESKPGTEERAYAHLLRGQALVGLAILARNTDRDAFLTQAEIALNRAIRNRASGMDSALSIMVEQQRALISGVNHRDIKELETAIDRFEIASDERVAEPDLNSTMARVYLARALLNSNTQSGGRDVGDRAEALAMRSLAELNHTENVVELALVRQCLGQACRRQADDLSGDARLQKLTASFGYSTLALQHLAAEVQKEAWATTQIQLAEALYQAAMLFSSSSQRKTTLQSAVAAYEQALPVLSPFEMDTHGFSIYAAMTQAHLELADMGSGKEPLIHREMAVNCYRAATLSARSHFSETAWFYLETRVAVAMIAIGAAAAKERAADIKATRERRQLYAAQIFSEAHQLLANALMRSPDGIAEEYLTIISENVFVCLCEWSQVLRDDERGRKLSEAFAASEITLNAFSHGKRSLWDHVVLLKWRALVQFGLAEITPDEQRTARLIDAMNCLKTALGRLKDGAEAGRHGTIRAELLDLVGQVEVGIAQKEEEPSTKLHAFRNAVRNFEMAEKIFHLNHQLAEATVSRKLDAKEQVDALEAAKLVLASFGAEKSEGKKKREIPRLVRVSLHAVIMLLLVLCVISIVSVSSRYGLEWHQDIMRVVNTYRVIAYRWCDGCLAFINASFRVEWRLTPLTRDILASLGLACGAANVELLLHKVPTVLNDAADVFLFRDRKKRRDNGATVGKIVEQVLFAVAFVIVVALGVWLLVQGIMPESGRFHAAWKPIKWIAGLLLILVGTSGFVRAAWYAQKAGGIFVAAAVVGFFIPGILWVAAIAVYCAVCWLAAQAIGRATVACFYCIVCAPVAAWRTIGMLFGLFILVMLLNYLMMLKS